MGRTYGAAIPGLRLPCTKVEERARSEKRSERGERSREERGARERSGEKREARRSEKREGAGSEREREGGARRRKREDVTPTKRLREGPDLVDPVDGSGRGQIAV